MKESAVSTDIISEDQKQSGKWNYMSTEIKARFISLAPLFGITANDACRENTCVSIRLPIPEEMRATMGLQ